MPTKTLSQKAGLRIARPYVYSVLLLCLVSYGCDPNSVSIDQLLQHPERFAKQTICLVLNSDQISQIMPGQTVTFYAFSKHQAKLNIDIKIPPDIDVVPATYGAPVVVTFYCESGSLYYGNTATEIRWPSMLEEAH